MPDRLDELRRQRALVADHLAWLDREIAGATPPTEERAPLDPAPLPLSAAKATVSTRAYAGSPANSSATPSAPADPDSILAEYRVEPKSVRQDVRKGCFLYFALAFILLFAAVGALWLLFRRS